MGWWAAGCPVCRKPTEADTAAGIPVQDSTPSSAAVETGAAEARKRCRQGHAAQNSAASVPADS